MTTEEEAAAMAECKRLNETFAFHDDGKVYGFTVRHEGKLYELSNHHHEHAGLNDAMRDNAFRQALHFAKHGPVTPYISPGTSPA